MKNHFLVTGATGFIGQYVLRRLLLREVPVVVIARESEGQSANDRVLSIVQGFERELGHEIPKPICFTGDLSAEMLGLDDNALDWFESNCSGVLHNAASIRFHAPDGDRTKDPWLSNLTGTKNVLELCRVAEIDHFHHVSTAYVSGTRTDVCYESELDEGQAYVNDYQASKVEAEKAIRAASFLKSRTFYRPGLVVGDSRNGFTTAPDFGLYHYIQFNATAIPQIRNALGISGTLELPFRLRFTGKERRNIVTVDWVADVVVHILTRPEYHNETYHLTPTQPNTSKSIVEALGEYFDYTGVKFVGRSEIDGELTDLEKLFYDYVNTFEAYWEDEPSFDRTNTDRVAAQHYPTPPVDRECLRRLITFAVENCFAAPAA